VTAEDTADTIEAAAVPESEKVEAPAEATEAAVAEVAEAVEAAPKAKTTPKGAPGGEKKKTKS